MKMTTYREAAHWGGHKLILCNEIAELDSESIYDINNWFYHKNDEENDEEWTMPEIHQWYLTDCSQDDVEWLTKTFDLIFTYSEKLNLFVLAVSDFGTMWDGVPCICYRDDLKIKEYND